MSTTSPSPSFAPLTVCPACMTRSLRPAEPEPLLPSRRCADCGGQFIRGEHYYGWLDHPDRAAKAGQVAEVTGEVIDTPQAKICPECGKLMRRYRVGHGVTFVIDRCGACGGVWFDANEWETLKRHGLHDRVHFVFSDAWRAQLLREEAGRVARSRVEAKVGSDDYAELERIADWIERHPHRDTIVAHLLRRVSGGPP
jgi:Zn-finger nucleic acid-binding protein